MFEESQITGTIVKSFIACKRQGWLAARGLSPSSQNDNIAMGETYSKIRDKNEKFGGIEVDDLSIGEHIVVKEYKKSFSNIDASTKQLLFYMYCLKRDVGARYVEGYVISEETMEKKHVVLNDENTFMVEMMIAEIIKTINFQRSPEFVKTNLCAACGHNLYCI